MARSRRGGALISPITGGGFPQPLAHVLRHSVSFITLIQTLAAFGRLSGQDRTIAVAVNVALALSWTVVTERRSGDWLDVVALTATVGFGAWLGVLTNNGQIYVTGYSSVFVAPFWYRRPRALIPSTAGVLAVSLSTMFVGKTDISGGIGNGVGVIFFGVAAWFWGRVLQSSERNAELVEELRDSRDAEQRGAAVAERARLARELHDVLAHTLSSLSLHLESTRVLAKSRDTDPEVQSRIDRAVALARSGLEEARDAVGTLRDDALPGAERLPALIADFARTAGVTCRFETTGTPAALSPEASVALFRSAQEALTNVGRHANATRVDVRLEWNDDHVTLRVIDDGGAAAVVPSLPSGGNGLRGMRERAELAGGRLDAGPTSRGFAIELRLPA